MGSRQAFEQGQWLNRAPTGYDMINGKLVADEMAPLVERMFALRTSGTSYPSIAAETGINYSTVRHILENRVYLGETTYAGQWGPGVHEALVSETQFQSATRAHTPGKRRSRDLLSGKVRCGLCGRVAGVHDNNRSQAIFRCRHRGTGCTAQPGRSAKGLQRAALLGMKVLSTDEDLQRAIRHELSSRHQPSAATGPTAASTVLSLGAKQRKLLDLFYADKIDPDGFAEENQRLSAQIATLRDQIAQREFDEHRRDAALGKFDQVATLLSQLDIDEIWSEATPGERRELVSEFVESVSIYPNELKVQITGAPPIRVALNEVGLRGGCKPVVSKGRSDRSDTKHWRLAV